MRLSLSLQMDVLKAKAGSILNTFKIYPRRDVLFFEDILAQYIRECEKAGFGREVFEIGKKSGALGTALLPPLLKGLPYEKVMDVIIKKVWKNLGLIDDFHVTRSKNKYTFITKNEFVTRIIGKNSFMWGACAGAAASFYKRDAVCREHTQTKESCIYVIEVINEPFKLATKELGLYSRLNTLKKAEGLSLKEALVSGFFQLDGNYTTFRGKTLLYLENTAFHLIGRSGVLLDRLSDITTSFFEGIVQKDASCNSKLLLFKNLLQFCGWGQISVIMEKEGIRVLIEHPPYGLQAEEDNWDFLSYFILGYLHVIDKKIVLYDVTMQDGALVLRYVGL